MPRLSSLPPRRLGAVAARAGGVRHREGDNRARWQLATLASNRTVVVAKRVKPGIPRQPLPAMTEIDDGLRSIGPIKQVASNIDHAEALRAASRRAIACS